MAVAAEAVVTDEPKQDDSCQKKRHCFFIIGALILVAVVITVLHVMLLPNKTILSPLPTTVPQPLT